MKNIAVLITCYNRVETTLNFLRTLNRQVYSKELNVDVYLVDDGSTDGTYESIKKQFPQVNLIKGTGELYWNGGMRLAWQKAITNCNASYDFFLLANDDISLNPDGVKHLFNCYNELKDCSNIGAVFGTFFDLNTGLISYGGKDIASKFNKLKLSNLKFSSKKHTKCDIFHGNLVLIPSDVVEEVGFLSERFTHSMGDYDLAYRLKAKGYESWTPRYTVGYCDTNEVNSKLTSSTLSLEKKLAILSNPVQIEPTKEWAYYVIQHAGWAVPLHLGKLLLRILAPKLFIRLFYERK